MLPSITCEICFKHLMFPAAQNDIHIYTDEIEIRNKFDNETHKLCDRCVFHSALRINFFFFFCLTLKASFLRFA